MTISGVLSPADTYSKVCRATLFKLSFWAAMRRKHVHRCLACSGQGLHVQPALRGCQTNISHALPHAIAICCSYAVAGCSQVALPLPRSDRPSLHCV